MATRCSPRRRRATTWGRWPLKRLLDLRLCELGLKLERTPLAARIQQVQDELERRDLRIAPYYWLSSDWFTPAGMTGTAIPFYLAHPRLMQLQRSQGGEVEGASHSWCMKILRHEMGHVIDHAFKLHLRRKRQQLFGLSSSHYPRLYRPNPFSKRHVQHLYYWYAQSHPDEDFAETFAVWLAPGSSWRQRYAEWPTALRKLEYVDELMAEIAGCKPRVRSRALIEPVERMTETLREHYARQENSMSGLYPGFYDSDLLHLFTTARGRRRPSAAAFIRRAKPEIVRLLTPWLGEHRYQLNHVLQDVLGRCQELKLYLRGSERAARWDVAVLVTKHTMSSLYRHRRWVEL